MNDWTQHSPAEPGDDYLDGNALAGPLSELFSIDMTSARGKCDSCGAVWEMAQARLYVKAPAMVLRCPSCEGVLLRFNESGGRIVLDLRGFSYLTIDLG